MLCLAVLSPLWAAAYLAAALKAGREVTVPWGLNGTYLRPGGELLRGVIWRLAADCGLAEAGLVVRRNGPRCGTCKVLVLLSTVTPLLTCVVTARRQVLRGHRHSMAGQAHVVFTIKRRRHQKRQLMDLWWSFFVFVFTLDILWHNRCRCWYLSNRYTSTR